MDVVYPSLAQGALSSARYSYIPDLVVPVEQQLAEAVEYDVEHDISWGVGQSARSGVQGYVHSSVSRLGLLVNSSVTKADDSFSGPMVDAVAAFLITGSERFPGIGNMVEQTLSTFTKAVLSQQTLGSFKERAYVGVGGTFEFWDGDRSVAEAQGTLLDTTLDVDVTALPDLRVVPFDQAKGYCSLDHLFPTDDVLIQVKRPWDFSRETSEYPNTHLTSISNSSATPYSTQWTVSVLSLVDFEVTADGASASYGLMEQPAESKRSIRVDLELPVTLHSAWPLEGVIYNPTNTIASDALEAARKFCEVVWDKLEPVFGWVKDGFQRAFGFLTDVFEVLSKFATRVLKAFASTMQILVETLQIGRAHV
jgi:hypothetical protein